MAEMVLAQLQREQDLEAKKLEVAELRCRRLRAELEVSSLLSQQHNQQQNQQQQRDQPITPNSHPPESSAPPAALASPVLQIPAQQVWYRPLTADASAVYATNAKNGEGLFMIPKTGVAKKSVACAALVNTPIGFAAVNDQYLYVMLRRFPHLPLTILVIAKYNFQAIERSLSLTDSNALGGEVIGLRAYDDHQCGILTAVAQRHSLQPEEVVFNLTTGAYVGSVLPPATSTATETLHANHCLSGPSDPLSPISISVLPPLPTSSIITATSSSSSSFVQPSTPDAAALSVDEDTRAPVAAQTNMNNPVAATAPVKRPTTKELLKCVQDKTLKEYANRLFVAHQNIRANMMLHFSIVFLALYHVDTSPSSVCDARSAFLKDLAVRNSSQHGAPVSHSSSWSKFWLAVYLQVLCDCAIQNEDGAIRRKVSVLLPHRFQYMIVCLCMQARRLLDFLLFEAVYLQEAFAPILVLQVPGAHRRAKFGPSGRRPPPPWVQDWDDAVLDHVLSHKHQWSSVPHNFMLQLDHVVHGVQPGTLQAPPPQSLSSSSSSSSSLDGPLSSQEGTATTAFVSSTALPGGRGGVLLNSQPLEDIPATTTTHTRWEDDVPVHGPPPAVAAATSDTTSPVFQTTIDDDDVKMAAGGVREEEKDAHQTLDTITNATLPHTNSHLEQQQQQQNKKRGRAASDSSVNGQTVTGNRKTKRQKTKPLSALCRQQMSLQRWLSHSEWSVEQVHESVCESWTGVSLASLRNWFAGNRHQSKHFIKHINDAVQHFRQYNCESSSALSSSAGDEEAEEAKEDSLLKDDEEEEDEPHHHHHQQRVLLDLEAIATAVLSGTDGLLFGVP